MAWLAGYAHRKEITVQDTNVDALLSDFPLLVRVSNDAALANCQADGDDIRFTASDGETLLPFEEDNWTGGATANVTAAWWVKVTSIAASGGATIYLYYENAGAANGEDADNTWRAEYKGVWHLSDLTDSSGNGNTLTDPGGAASPSSGATGKVGTAYDFTPNDYLHITAWSDVTDEPFSLTALANLDNATAYHWLISIGDADQPVYHALTARGDEAGDYLHAHSYDGTSSQAATTAGYTANTWFHGAAVFASNTSRSAYINGAAKGSLADDINVTGIDHLTIGVSADSTPIGYADGTIDEVRIYAGTLADAWIKFEYANIFEADNELTWGAEEDPPAGGLSIPIAMHHYKMLRN